ncbi:MAG: hypothetical protein UY31_C0033G0002 [Candidatus Wolfebacteria bacterium GW2011_GWE1_48_7]|uniref:PrgI family protein n=2 Tax=Candidatus Wolfeibacteriota TaxID=1752735 RepID=A0A0G1U6P6_9BACT|nr:MAG: hypothetical protein UX70_C0001G0905 [Candidatus Wolfebacteria bacterium GW2011_GWB1_47_1]KKU35816.1 MAG: hypothetical protein UX49_C0024G0002 [Candidatus Wolfebacteria bacterium GW2011_GWC2_46_275]KKU42190.1 MAG: hypothetical protein UX58_C0003G0115 [Candidatus Wolfebacteria bacterium GW2011_GWB2_46_69]KKU53812.1 MAG: hypothetical protein UX76_C0009G0002 [Candidatus Wolfebacteria bacterium GW2011_GWC1_47_103]KKU59459.1 MAG: hypothetical protein UX83_C0005G0078 [Candidatus Wolfebacteria
MQFQIPQFIEIEDKIAGPFSLRQLLYVVGGGVVAFLAFTTMPFLAGAIVALISLGGALALALVKVNGQPLTRIAFAAVGFFWKPRLYLWKREIKERVIEVPEFANIKPTTAPVPEEKIIDQRNTLKQFTAQMPSINKLSSDLTTRKNPIPQREKAIPAAVAEKLSIFRRQTGEQEVAKRVDFR